MDLREAALADRVAPARHPWERARVRVLLSLLRDGAPRWFSGPVTVLDVGCGDTFVVERLSAAMPRARFLAVDSAFTSELLAAYAARHDGGAASIELFADLAAAARARPGAIDGVLLLDVIEHVADDVAFVRTVCRQPGVHADTVFLVTVPAFQGLFTGHDVFLGHHRRYRRALLHERLRAAGLGVMQSGYFFTSLLVPRVAARLLETLVRPRASRGVADWRGGALAGGLVEAVLVADFRATHALSRLGVRLPGLSVYALCRPSA